MDSLRPDSQDRRLRWLVTLLCLCGAGAGGYTLWLDLNERGLAGKGPPIAKVDRRAARVRRKPQGSYVWSNVQSAEELYRRDSLQTGVESNASVHFHNGAVLELGENSLIIVDDVDQLNLGVLRGNAVIRSADGVAADRRVSVGSDGQTKIEQISVRLVKPEPLARFFAAGKEGREVSFGWESRGNSSEQKPRLEISADRAFRADRTQTIEAATAAAAVMLAPGRWYWRVSGQSGPLTETRQLRIAQALPLTPVYPSSSQPVSRWGDENNIRFRWVNPGDDAHDGKHTLQIATSSDFANTSRELSITAENAAETVEGLREGRWFWRIKSQYGEVAVTSAPMAFTIERAKELNLALSFPGEGASIEASGRLPFNWECDLPGAEYRWELQTLQGEAVADSSGPARSAAWPKARAGQFRWRVSASLKGKKVGESPWRSLALFQGAPLVLTAPKRGQEIQYWDEPTKFSFAWKDDPQIASEGVQYALELSRGAEFKEVALSKKSKTPLLPSESLNLEAGTWWWRVKVVDSAGEVLKTSDAQQFSFGLFPPPKPPGGLAAAQTYNPLQQEKPPVISWSKAPDAIEYEVFLYEAQAERAPAAGGQAKLVPGKLVKQEVVSSTSYELSRKLKEGEYLWSVRSVDKLKRRGDPSQATRFKVTYGAPLAAPEVTSSEVQ